jgi:hypothetical protein
MPRVQVASVVLASIAFAAGPTAAQTPRPPPTVAAKIAVMDTACGVAGGKPAGGAYIFVYDFTGDGVNDYLVSEGNYQCAGKPDLFRPGGKAVVEIYVSNAGDAQRVFYETVRGYRILDGRPRSVQVMRDGAACGGGAATCTVTLRYDGPTHRFTTGSGLGAPPAISQGGANDQPAAAPRTAQASGAPSGPTPAAAPSVAETQTVFMARCRRERLALDRRMTVAQADSSCEDIWTKAVAALPAANAILALGGGAPGPMSQATVRAAFSGATWGGRPSPGVPSSGRLGQWSIALRGQTLINEVSFEWGKKGDSTPYDVVEALRVRGARVTSVACYGYGASEQNNVYRVEAPGRPPFGVRIYDHHAGTAVETANYNVVVELNGTAPTFASVKRGPDGAEYQARCED